MHGHSSDISPIMQNDPIEHANAISRGFNSNPQHKYDPFSQTYNSSWRDHPNLRSGNQ